MPLEHWPYNKSRDIACIDASAPLNCAPLPPHFLAARAQKHLNFLGKVPAGEEEGERERESDRKGEREEAHAHRTSITCRQLVCQQPARYVTLDK